MYISLIMTCLLLSCGVVSPAKVYEWGNPNISNPIDSTANLWDGTATGWLLNQNSTVFGSETLPLTLDGSTTTDQHGLFQPSSSTYDESNVLTGERLVIKGDVKIKGDVELRFTGNQPATVHEVFEVDIGEVGGTEPVTIGAFNDSTTTSASFSQLVFNVAQGKTLVVNVLNDLFFYSADALEGYDPAADPDVGAPLPLYVTFRGKGTTVFRLPSGKRLYFGPQNPGKTSEGSIIGDIPLSKCGVRVQILMEQSSLDVYGSSNVETPVLPRSQVVFEKWSYAQESTVGAVNTNTSLHTWITIGQHSSFTFISDNYQGVAEKWIDLNADGGINLGETVSRPGYGSVAFDPSNEGSGRMILEIARGQKPSGNDFTDGGFNLYGAFIAPSLPATDRTSAVILNEDLRTTVFFNQRAGIRAIMRVLDDVAYYDRALPVSSWMSRPDTDKRGLVVINHNNSIPHFANNYDGALSIDTNRWAQHNDYQPGFVIGVNGLIEVNPHLFLDYYANNVNKAIGSVHAPITTTHSADKVKKHNPAALYTDTVPTYSRRTQYQLDQFGVPISDILYMGYRPEFGSMATVSLLGNAAFYARSVAPFVSDALTRPLFIQPQHNGHYHLQPSNGGNVITIPLGLGVYDGYSVPIINNQGVAVMQSADPEGSHALDVEGAFALTSAPYSTLDEQNTLLTIPASGMFFVPPVEINYQGLEVGYANFELWSAWEHWRAVTPGREATTITLSDGSTVVFDATTSIELTQAAYTQRPLPYNKWYGVYDVSSVLVNAPLYCDNMQWHHADVLRDLPTPQLVPTPFKAARPHIVGGELADLQLKLDPPVISCNNTTFACHESLIATGVTFSVSDLLADPNIGPSSATNESKFLCYNRGKSYDVFGYGRVVQLGSQGNIAADGITTSERMSSAYLDVYRAGPTEGASADNPTTIRMGVVSAYEQGVSSHEAGLHLLYLANESQVRLGWNVTEADTGYTPNGLTTSILSSLIKDDPLNKKGFRFSAYDTGCGELQFSGGPFCIGAGDSVEALAPDQPLPGIDVGGSVYVNHGGKLSVSGTTDLFINTIIARRIAADSRAIGQLVLPRDQVYYLASGAVQNYDIDFVADKVASGAYADHVLLDFHAPVHLFDVQKLYPSTEFDQVK